MSELYNKGFYDNNNEETIIKYINDNKDMVLIPREYNNLLIHLYCWGEYKKSKEIINLLINNNPNILLISNQIGFLPIHCYCYSECEKSKEIINHLINYDINNLLIPNNLGNLPIHEYCGCKYKKSIEIIDYLLYNYDINNIRYIHKCPPYVEYYLYKIYNWKFYDKKLFLYMMITKLQKLIKIVLWFSVTRKPLTHFYINPKGFI